jgi:maltose alpha-D-glucosyltransferase/alpha-amylase
VVLNQCKPAAENKYGNITGNYTLPEGFPDWLHQAVFYQIYPQTFYDTDGDGIGDLRGITEKLDYVKSLGVDGIWLNPFFESPFCDAGYDISDYYKVAPRYGTNEDARVLFEEAHKRGLKVIFDYVISYTSIEHPWFIASAQQDTNRYSNWYIWNDNTWMNPPEAFKDAFVKGYSRRNGQFMRNFYWCQPALNFGFAKPEQPWMLPVDHPDIRAMQEELKNVLRFWMDMGADGFRADMAGALVKNANISGNDQFFNARDEATKQFWHGIRQLMDQEYPGSVMIAEWSYPKDALDKLFHADFFHWFEGYNDLFQKESWRILNGYSEGHSFFDLEGKGNITHFLESYLEQYKATAGKGYISLPLGNHDNARLGNNRSDADLEIIYAFALTMPGLPFLYYGNETGMRQLGADWPQVEGAYKPRNGARTPMQWSGEKNLGFSVAPAEKLYLPVDPSADAPTVAAQETDEASLLNRTRKLIALRHSEPALSAYAEFVPLYARENSYPFVYARAKDKEVVMVCLNPSGMDAEASFTLPFNTGEMMLLSGKELMITRDGKNMSIRMPGQRYAIYKFTIPAL